MREKWGPALFVLLGGNIDIIPARMVAGEKNRSWPTDLYYATTLDRWYDNDNQYKFKQSMNGHDFYVGRAPAKNKDDAEIFVNKILTYEKSIAVKEASYYRSFLLASAFLNRDNNGTRKSDDYHNLKIYRDSINKYANTRLMIDNHDNTNQFEYVYDDIDTIAGDEEFNKANFLSALNSGKFHLVYHCDHSIISMIGSSSKDKNENVARSDIDGLTNGNLLQIMYSGGCEPATFSEDCFGARYIGNPNGGGVAFIGNSDTGWSGERARLQNFISRIYDNTNYSLGYIFRHTPDLDVDERRRLTLLGDPTMQVWTDTPQKLEVKVKPLPDVAGKMKISIEVKNCPLDSATVCIMKGDDAYKVFKTASKAQQTYTINSFTSDSIYVNVTAQNYIPYEEAISSNITYNTNLSIDKHYIADGKAAGSKGNADGQLDAGETISLSIRLKNTGKETTTPLSATLRCNSNYITLIDSTTNFASIAPNSTALATKVHLFRIDRNTPNISKDDIKPITFQVIVKDENGIEYRDKFNIDVFTSKLEQRNKIVTGVVEKGSKIKLDIDLFNLEKSRTTKLKASLISTSTNATVLSGVSSYDEIGFQETKTNKIPFEVQISSAYKVGDLLTFKLRVQDEYEKDTLFSFDLDRPDLVSSVVSTGYQNSIQIQWYNLRGIQGYNIYRSDANLDGSDKGEYHKVNTFILPYSYFEDYNLNPLTQYYYKISVVSKTGNEGQLSSSWLSSTTPPTKGLFPVKIDDNLGSIMNGAVTVFDVNNDNKKEVFTVLGKWDAINSKGYVIGLNSEGEELSNLDGNTTTYSGFADVKTYILAPIAISHMFGTDKSYVVSATRSSDGGKNYITCHTVEYTNEQGVPDIRWQIETTDQFLKGPIISDNLLNDSVQIILRSDSNNKLIVLDQNGEEQWSTIIPSGGNYSAVAVADLDGDGYKEIIVGATNGIYVWRHDGSIYKGSPFYARSGYSFISTPVVCDLDNDGVKDIITRAISSSGTNTVIHVIDANGLLKTGWGTSQSISTKASAFSRDVSVGDLQGNGMLSVVAQDNNLIKAWDHAGKETLKIDVKGTQSGMPPLLADMDGDGINDIVVAPYVFTLDRNNKEEFVSSHIEVYNGVGEEVKGFPLRFNSKIASVPAITDLENNGENNLVVANGGRINVWKTEGRVSQQKFGLDRINSQNTGELITCQSTVIKQNTSCSFRDNICGNIIIESATYTIPKRSVLTMDNSSLLIVRAGAKLVVEGAINSANIKALPGSSVIIKGSGTITLRKNGELNIQNGALYELHSGTIKMQ